MSRDAFELLVFFFMCVWLVSTICEQIKTGIADCRKAEEKVKEKKKNEIMNLQDNGKKRPKRQRKDEL